MEWLPSRCPSARIRSTLALFAWAQSPVRKNVALTCSVERVDRMLAKAAEFAPASKVSATSFPAPGSSSRSRPNNASGSAATDGPPVSDSPGSGPTLGDPSGSGETVDALGPGERESVDVVGVIIDEADVVDTAPGTPCGCVVTKSMAPPARIIRASKTTTATTRRRALLSDAAAAAGPASFTSAWPSRQYAGVAVARDRRHPDPGGTADIRRAAALRR